MNYRNVASLLGRLMVIFAALMAAPLLVAIAYRENALPFGITIVCTAAAGFGLSRLDTGNGRLYTRDGLTLVGLAWVVLALIGAIPLWAAGDIPNYLDAVFETVSGLTTTGASVVENVDGMTRSGVFWRSFTHWIGGMGILVFMMAIMPMNGEHSMHILRAEVPGPVVGKIVPRTKKTSSILYVIYTLLTLLEIVLLMAGGMEAFDACLYAFGTAGTGGFAPSNAGIAAYNSVYLEMVIGVFLIIFAANFNLYYLIYIGRIKDALKSEELHWYLTIIAIFTLAITAGTAGVYGSFGQGIRYAFFYVTSIMSTAGFTSVDYNLWPEYTKVLLVALMLIGGCAGGTAGGLKVSRVIILIKSALKNIAKTFSPRTVRCVEIDKKRVDSATENAVTTYFNIYIGLLMAVTFIISFDGYDLVTSFTAALSSLSNVGPGLGLVGPAGSFAIFSPISKLAMIMAMLLGRLELYSVFALFMPDRRRRRRRKQEI